MLIAVVAAQHSSGPRCNYSGTTSAVDHSHRPQLSLRSVLDSTHFDPDDENSGCGTDVWSFNSFGTINAFILHSF